MKSISFIGKVDIKNGVKTINSPVFDPEDKSVNTSKILPVYPLTEDIKPSTFRKIMSNCLENIGEISETMPEYIIQKYHLFDLDSAIRQIHFPKNMEEATKARRRLVFDEFLISELGLLRLKNENQVLSKGITYSKDVKMSDVINKLPFRLTKAQLRVLEDIDDDMEKPIAMNRLLQGDVGSRKNYCFNYCKLQSC